MRGISIFLIFVAIGILSGCGSLTKMRYSRGFKSNFELNLKKKEKDVPRIVARKATKKQSINNYRPCIEIAKNYHERENDSSERFNTIASNHFQAYTKSSENIQSSIPTVNQTTTIKKPLHTTRIFEPHTNWAIFSFILCLGFGLLALIFLSPGLIFPAFLIGEISAILSLLLAFCTFVLSIVSLSKIKKASIEYSGTTINILLILLTAPVVLYVLFFGVLILFSIF